MVYLIASLLIHGILFAYTGLTFIPHAQYSVQPSDQMVEVSIEEIKYFGGSSQQEGRPIKSSEKTVKAERLIHSISGVKVSAKPDYIQNPPPSYPELARQMRQEGLVMVSVDVSREGYPLNTAIIESSGYPLLDQAALNAVRHWKFQPGRVGNIFIESTVTVPIRFRLEK